MHFLTHSADFNNRVIPEYWHLDYVEIVPPAFLGPAYLIYTV